MGFFTFVGVVVVGLLALIGLIIVTTLVAIAFTEK